MEIIDNKLIVENRDEAVQIIKDLGLEPCITGTYTVMGRLYNNIFQRNYDYPVLWDMNSGDDAENGAFKMYDNLFMTNDTFGYLAWAGFDKRYARSLENLKTRIADLKHELLKTQNKFLEKSIDILD